MAGQTAGVSLGSKPGQLQKVHVLNRQNRTMPLSELHGKALKASTAAMSDLRNE